MAIQRGHASKAPSENPVEFYKLRQQGGAYGRAERVPERLPEFNNMQERIWGRPSLGARADKSSTTVSMTKSSAK